MSFWIPLYSENRDTSIIIPQALVMFKNDLAQNTKLAPGYVIGYSKQAATEWCNGTIDGNLQHPPDQQNLPTFGETCWLYQGH